MIKLKNPRGFEASKLTVFVNIEGSDYECANLLKSGIINQNVALVAIDEVWHEFNVLNLGAENSNLQELKNLCEINPFTLVDFGVKSKHESKLLSYGSSHEDYMKIEALYPDYPYFMIGKLHKYLEQTRSCVPYFDLVGHVRMCSIRGETIDNHIVTLERMKNNIINNKHPLDMTNTVDERIAQLLTFDAKEVDGNYLVVGMEITGEMITTLPEGGWNQIIAGIEMLAPKKEAVEALVGGPNEYHSAPAAPVAAAPVAPAAAAAPKESEALPAEVLIPGTEIKPGLTIALEGFSTMTPANIAELQGLKEKQELIVSENPIVEITDKKTYDLAKKQAGVLLKASTAIDGEKGIETLATKHLNTFKKMLQTAIKPLAAITRSQYDKQKQIIDKYENAEALRKQAEETAKLKKIKDRTDLLFAIPMTFNGTSYNIGTLFIMPSQIETATDEDFAALVEQANQIKATQDSEAAAEAGKDDVIRKMAATIAVAQNKPVEQVIAEMTGKPYVPAPVAPAAETATPVAAPVAAPVAPKKEFFISTPTVEGASIIAAMPVVESPQQALAKWVAATCYTMPEPDNKLMNEMDLQNVDHLEKPAYIKCRSYYAKGLVDAALEIERILNEGGKKPEVVAFLEIIKKSM